MKEIIFLFIVFCSLLFQTNLSSQAISVEVIFENNSWTLKRGGEDYRILGGGTSNTSRFKELHERGGNSVRTWGTGPETLSVLDSAQYYGLTVMIGLWIGREKDGFDYNDPVTVAEQLNHISDIVLQYKDHPALLAWGIGNEANLGYSNTKVWDAVNDISRMIHEVDGQHPTLTVTAGISIQLANVLSEKAYDLDMLGVNSYGGIGGVKNNIAQSNWEKPYIMTEWGINGPWEIAKSSWGAPIEPTSKQKAQTFSTRYDLFIAANTTNLLGSYAFLWNEKFEGTLTWFGLFVLNETTPMVDVLEKKWTGQEAQNKAPVIENWNYQGQGQKTSYKIFTSINNEFTVEAYDPEGDSLQFEFLLRPESGSEGLTNIPGASHEGIPGVIDELSPGKAMLRFNSNHNEKALRLYVFVRDGQGHVATLNWPIKTQLIDLEEEFEFNPIEDAYVQNASSENIAFGVIDAEQLMITKNFSNNAFSESYLLFDLTQSPPVYDKVFLEIFGEGPVDQKIELWGFGGHYWDEKTLTWNSRIIPGSGVLTKSQWRSMDNAPFVFDISDFIEKQFTQHNKIITFVLRAEISSEESFVLKSKEISWAKPRLYFEFESALNDAAQLNNLLVYPNPFSKQIIIDGVNVQRYLFKQINLYSSDGSLLKTFYHQDIPLTLDLSDCHSGSYYLEFIHQKTGLKVSRKIIKY